MRVAALGPGESIVKNLCVQAEPVRSLSLSLFDWHAHCSSTLTTDFRRLHFIIWKGQNCEKQRMKPQRQGQLSRSHHTFLRRSLRSTQRTLLFSLDLVPFLRRPKPPLAPS